MKRTIIRLLLNAAAFLGVNAGIAGFAAAKGAPTVLPWEIGVPLLIVLFQAAIILNARILPLETKKQKAVYWVISETLFALTAGIWGYIILTALLS